MDCKVRGTKKTNCKWKIKFWKRQGKKYYELVPSGSQVHNHHLQVRKVVEGMGVSKQVFGYDRRSFGSDCTGDSQSNQFDMTHASVSDSETKDASFDK